MDLAVLEPLLKDLLHQQHEMVAEREKESESRQQLVVKLEVVKKKVDTFYYSPAS